MYEVGPVHPLSYRQEIVAPLFRAIRAAESCALIGSSSMGKSRLVQHFIMRPDVREHYLSERSTSTLLVLADGNDLEEVSEWGLYELLLTAILKACGRHPSAAQLRPELLELRREAITSRDALLARRNAELAIHILCQEHGLTLALILDEFDECYRMLPARCFAQLRHMRDTNRYRLCYILGLRMHPEQLRPTNDCEGFYELLARTILGVGPYTPEDALRVIEQLEARHERSLPSHTRHDIVAMSGGHPGLIVALFSVLLNHEMFPPENWLEWGAAQHTIQEESRKIWSGLSEEERQALNDYAQGLPLDDDVRRVLLLKGLVRSSDEGDRLFSPLFERFVRMQEEGLPLLRIDIRTSEVWIGKRRVKLIGGPYKLLTYLYERSPETCTKDELLEHLFPDEVHDDGPLVNTIRRIRQRIEPVPGVQHYLKTVWDIGYRLENTDRAASAKLHAE